MLKDNKVKATFFVIGKSLEDPEMVTILKRAFMEGHLIASHSYSHADLALLSPEGVKEEIQKTEEIIYQAIGVRVRYVRPPFGSYKAETNEVFSELDNKSILWNLDTNDWKHKENPEKIVSITVDALRTGFSNSEISLEGPGATTGFISLQHDVHKSTVDVQDDLIKKIKNTKPDIKFLLVDECLGFQSGDGYHGNPDTPGADTSSGDADADTDTSTGYVNAVSITMSLIIFAIAMW